jgi:hypothetical protein
MVTASTTVASPVPPGGYATVAEESRMGGTIGGAAVSDCGGDGGAARAVGVKMITEMTRTRCSAARAKVPGQYVE